MAFENEAPSTNRMKSIFLFTLWSWVKLYSVDNFDSLVEFLTWLRYRWHEFFLGIPFCTSLVYSLGALCLFLIYTLLFINQKKKKKTYFMDQKIKNIKD